MSPWFFFAIILDMKYRIIIAVMVLIAGSVTGVLAQNEKEKNSEFISWDKAVVLLNQGKVYAVVQPEFSNDLFVLRDGTHVKIREDYSDKISEEIDRCGAICKKIVYIND